MLVLTRKTGDELIIDGNIRVVVLSVKANQVRLGFEAPPDVTIVRSELLEVPQPAGRAAALLDETPPPRHERAFHGARQRRQ